MCKSIAGCSFDWTAKQSLPHCLFCGVSTNSFKMISEIDSIHGTTPYQDMNSMNSINGTATYQDMNMDSESRKKVHFLAGLIYRYQCVWDFSVFFFDIKHQRQYWI